MPPNLSFFFFCFKIQNILNSNRPPRFINSINIKNTPNDWAGKKWALYNGIQKSIGEIIPDLKGKLEGVAMRVPTPNVSLIELGFCTKKQITKEQINKVFTQASKKKLKKVLKITSEKLVSVDFNHNPASAIVDSSLTSVIGNNMGKISAWYDNEWGFSCRMCDISEYLHKIS